MDKIVSNTRWSQPPSSAAREQIRDMFEGLSACPSTNKRMMIDELTRRCCSDECSDSELDALCRTIDHLCSFPKIAGSVSSDVAETIVELAADGSLASSKLILAINALERLIPRLSVGGLTSLAQRLIRTGLSEDGAMLQQLPHVIIAISSHSSVPFNREAGPTVTGAEYCTNALGQLASAPWKPKQAIAICTVIREISMASDLMLKFVGRFAAQFKLIDVQLLPSLVYQLLLLVHRAPASVQRLLLRSLVSHFDDLDATAESGGPGRGPGSSQLRNVEGAIYGLPHQAALIILLATVRN